MCFFWDSCDQENVLEFRLNSETILEFEICVFCGTVVIKKMSWDFEKPRDIFGV